MYLAFFAIFIASSSIQVVGTQCKKRRVRTGKERERVRFSHQLLSPFFVPPLFFFFALRLDAAPQPGLGSWPQLTERLEEGTREAFCLPPFP